MRLINTTTFQIEDFSGRKVPRYAILSHTWGKEELTFQDWLYSQDQSPPRWGWVQIPDEIQLLKSKEGYVKVAKACERAREDGFGWLWADTVCIDKSSSAELSEAINSMFAWYRASEVCYALLVDVPPMSEEEVGQCSKRKNPFRESRWFRRGWTLQELVAPWNVIFLSRDWTSFGTKATLLTHLAAITSIPELCLSGNWTRVRAQTSIADKMSWAVSRRTTRIEDRAYCLMGLFDVNMPLLYGEGEKAFLRLQEEIIKTTEDLSILAWNSDRSHIVARDHLIQWRLPPFADSPSKFSSARRMMLNMGAELMAGKRLVTANTGIFIHRPLFGTLSPLFLFAPLNVEVPNWSRGKPAESVLIPLVMDRQSMAFERCSFPASTVVTRLKPSQCAHYTGDVNEVCLRRLYEPSPDRRYFRKTPVQLGRHQRQVGVLPVFASRKPWMKVAGAYPWTGGPNSLIFNLAEAGDSLYHGILLFHGPRIRVNALGLAVYFLVIFDRHRNKPLLWRTIEVRNLEVYVDSYTDHLQSSTDYLQSMTESITNDIFPRNFRNDPKDFAIMTAAIKRKSSWQHITRKHGSESDSGTYARMDSHWHVFKGSGTGSSNFVTFINLVLIGMTRAERPQPQSQPVADNHET